MKFQKNFRFLLFLAMELILFQGIQCKTSLLSPKLSQAVQPTVQHFTTCSKGKKLPHPQNPTKYYECQFISKADVWLSQPLNCLDGQIFDEVKQICVSKSSSVQTSQRKNMIAPAIPTFPNSVLSRRASVAGTAEVSNGKVPTNVNGHNSAVSTTIPIQSEIAGSNSNELIVKLATSIQSLASTVRILASNQGSSANKITQATEDEFNSVENQNFQDYMNDDENILYNDEGPALKESIASILKRPGNLAPFNVLVHQGQVEQTKPPAKLSGTSIIPEVQEVKGEDVENEFNPINNNSESNESSDEQDSSSENSPDKPFESSFLRLFIKNFLPQSKIISSIPFPQMSIPMRRVGEPIHDNSPQFLQVTSTTPLPIPTISTSTSTTEKPFNITTTSTSPPQPQIIRTKFPAFEYHHFIGKTPATGVEPRVPITSIISHSPPAPAPPSTSNNNNEFNGSLLNLFELFKQLKRGLGGEQQEGEEEDESDEDSHHRRQHFPNLPPKGLIHPNLLINKSNGPFIFQRIPHSSPSSPSSPNNINWPLFLQSNHNDNDSPLQPNTAASSTQLRDKSLNLRHPRQL